MANSRNNKKGLIGAVLFHGIVIFILYSFGFITPLPLPTEEGIEVNFGTEEEGFGMEEPTAEMNEAVVEETYEPVTNQAEADEAYLTQDIEDAPEMNSTKKEVKKEEKKPDPEEIERQREIERQKEIERKREEEQKRIKKEKEQKDAINNMITGAFSKSENENQNTNEGISGGEGNQGVEEGNPNSDNYSNIHSAGSGGISSNLEGRNPQSLPKPKYDHQVEGKVVVEVTVDRQGRVTKAVPGIKGSTTPNENLLNAAREAALKSKFDTKLDEKKKKKGTITYLFKLQ